MTIFLPPLISWRTLRVSQATSKYKTSLLGPDSLGPPTNDFMEWLTNGGPQFTTSSLKKPVSFSIFFFHINISLKKALIHDFRFDLDFKGYGWEDTELGYRLTKESQMQIIYWPAAVATHDHKMEASSLPGKMEQIGRNAKYFRKNIQSLEFFQEGLKNTTYHWFSKTHTSNPT